MVATLSSGDTIRRNRELSAEGFNFIGTGVSGGEEGALKGPSIMPVVRKRPMNWLLLF
ncbi:NAD(P)-binding domain-containing protein [Escherichia coli]